MADETTNADGRAVHLSEGGDRGGARLDFISVAGLAVALAGVIGGLLIDGGKIREIAQLTAALIVLGGTIGAVMFSTPLRTLKGACKPVSGSFFRLFAGSEERIGGTDRLCQQSP